MTRKVDVAVLGLGAMGSAVLYQLAKRGVAVIGIDRFAPPHAFGSSHGETRITRQAVGEGADYIPFVTASHRIWRELEAETGETLFEACGALVMAPGHGVSSHHGKPDFVGRSISAAEGAGIPHEVLNGAEVARRFPQFLNLAGDEKAYYEPGGGYVIPERCLAAQLTGATAAGAEIRTGCAVRALRQEGSGIRIETADGVIQADRAVVAAGAWTAPLLGGPFDRLLTVRRQLLHWYALADTTAYGPRAPVFIWMYGTSDTEYLYGFPPMPGENAIKVATEQYSTSTTADAVERRVDPVESADMYRLRVENRLAGATADVVRSAACVYTVTPDRGFIIDRHPEMDRVIVVSACSGHGFKHSAGIGAAIAADLAGQTDRFDLAPFALARFG